MVNISSDTETQEPDPLVKAVGSQSFSHMGLPCTLLVVLGARPLATYELIPDNEKLRKLWQLRSPFIYDLAEIASNVR